MIPYDSINSTSSVVSLSISSRKRSHIGGDADYFLTSRNPQEVNHYPLLICQLFSEFPVQLTIIGIGRIVSQEFNYTTGLVTILNAAWFQNWPFLFGTLFARLNQRKFVASIFFLISGFGLVVCTFFYETEYIIIPVYSASLFSLFLGKTFLGSLAIRSESTQANVRWSDFMQGQLELSICLGRLFAAGISVLISNFFHERLLFFAAALACGISFISSTFIIEMPQEKFESTALEIIWDESKRLKIILLFVFFAGLPSCFYSYFISWLVHRGFNTTQGNTDAFSDQGGSLAGGLLFLTITYYCGKYNIDIWPKLGLICQILCATIQTSIVGILTYFVRGNDSTDFILLITIQVGSGFFFALFCGFQLAFIARVAKWKQETVGFSLVNGVYNISVMMGTIISFFIVLPKLGITDEHLDNTYQYIFGAAVLTFLQLFFIPSIDKNWLSLAKPFDI